MTDSRDIPGAAAARPGFARAELVVALAIVLVAECAWALLLDVHAPSLSAGGRWLCLVLVVLAVGHLTFPMRRRLPESLARDLLGWPVLLGTCAGLAGVLAGGASVTAAVFLGAGAAVLAACLESATRALVAAGAPVALAMAGVLLVFTAALLAPLWLGPLAELHAAREGVTDAVVAVSPLGYLAALTEYDVLREQWFYARSPLGSLRVTYPGVIPASVAYAGIALAAAWLARVLRQRPAGGASSVIDGARR